MFAAKQKQSEPDHLKPLDEAKRIFKLRLKSRIDSYEKRLKKPWYERGFEYLKSSYGKAGYLRKSPGSSPFVMQPPAKKISFQFLSFIVSYRLIEL